MSHKRNVLKNNFMHNTRRLSIFWHPIDFERGEFSVLLIWDETVAACFPRLCVSLGIIRNIKVECTNAETKRLRTLVFDEVRSTFKLEKLKDDSVVRAYRDFFWALKIDPTKTRPSGEALLRRVLRGKDIPQISSAVDAYNLASLKTIIPISGFDLDTITPPLQIRFSKKSDMFQGIDMQASKQLDENLLLVTDKSQVLCIYPHRDADATKITGKTANILLVGYGAPEISKNQVVKAVKLALSYINTTSGGKIEDVEVFPATS